MASLSDSPSPPALPGSRAEWNAFDRIAFRYLCCHWLLYAFPSPFSSLLSAARGIWGWFLSDGDEMPQWATTTFSKLGEWSAKPNEWWSKLTSWLSDRDLTFGIEVIHQPTGSGDTGAAFVKLGCIVLFSILLTALWSLLDRRRSGHPVLGRWVHLGARWYVGLNVFGYGVAKFYGGQFAEPTISALTREVGDHSPMGLVWTFMGASQPYNYLAGAGEIASLVLLLHRRTALLGCFVTVAVMGNVCAINWLYGWPVKLYSGHLWLTALFLMAPYRQRLWALFVSNQPSQPVDLRVVKSRQFGWPLLAIGSLWAVGTVVNTFDSYSESWNQRLETTFKKPELYGLWTVETMLLDGEQVPYSDSSRWESFVIDRGGRASAKTLLGQVHPFIYDEDLDAGAITLTPRGEGTEAIWNIERSTVTRKVPHPAPKTREEWGSQIDGEVEAVVFRGLWEDQELELQTVKKVFRIHDPFRLIREFPR